MKCEYCDSFLPVFPDNGCCPNCGAVLPAPEPEKPEFTEPPLGIYNGVYGSMEVGQSSVRIRKERILHTDYSDFEIPYDELTGVVFQPARNRSEGYLSLRCGLNQAMPFPRNCSEGQLDLTTVIVPEDANTKFEKVSAFLNRCVEENRNGSKKRTISMQFPVPPMGAYKGVQGSLEVWENCICITRESLTKQQTRYVMPYKDLFAVAFREASWSESGFINLRCWQNRRMRFDAAAHDAELCLCFQKNMQEQMRHIYRFLQECARIANAAREEK